MELRISKDLVVDFPQAKMDAVFKSVEKDRERWGNCKLLKWDDPAGYLKNIFIFTQMFFNYENGWGIRQDSEFYDDFPELRGCTCASYFMNVVLNSTENAIKDPRYPRKDVCEAWCAAHWDAEEDVEAEFLDMVAQVCVEMKSGKRTDYLIKGL